MSVIGTLEIQLLANVAKLQADMDKSKSVVSDTMKQIESAVNLAKQAFIAFTGVTGVEALKGIVLGSIESIAKLHELSIQCGVTVEALSGLAAVGRATGTGADTISAASNKLSKALASSNEESKGAATALKALGLSFDDFQKMSPDERIQKVAVAMKQFEDGGQKSAAAMMLFGKTGAEMLPFLKDLAVAGELHAKVTTEQAEAAHEFEKAMGQLKANGDAWKKSLAMELLPTLNDLVAVMLTIKQSSKDTGTVIGEGLKVVLQTLGVVVVNTLYVVKQLGVELGGMGAQLMALAHLDFKGFSSIGDMMKEDAKAARIEVDKLSSSLLGLTNSKAGAGRGGTSTTDPRSLGVGDEGLKQLQGLNGSANGAPQINEALNLLNSLKTKYEQLTGTVSEYAQVVRQLDAMKTPVSDSTRKEILNLALLIQSEKDAASAKKLHIASYVEQANKEADAAKRQEDFVAASNDARAAIIEQTNVLGMDADELAKHNALRQIDLLLQKASVNASADQIQALEKLATTMKSGVSEGMDALKAKQDALNGTWTVGAKNALDAYQKNITNVAAFTQNAFANAFKGMEDALVNFVTTGKLDFTSLVNSMISDLVRYQIQQSIMKPMMAAMGSAGGAGGIMSLLGFASGGQPPVGVPSIVGEKGPEIFVPSTAGTIVPNHALGGSNVTVNVIEDSSKAGTQQQRTTAGGGNVIDVFVAQVKAAIASDISRGSGAIPSAMQQAYGVNRVAGAY